MVWSQSTGALRGHEGQPLVIEDVGGKPMMFFISGCPNMAQCNIVQASLPIRTIPSRSGTTSRRPIATSRLCRAHAATPSIAALHYANGKIVYGTLDGYVIALDAPTGKEVWVVKHAYPEKGETITPAPT